MERFDSPASFLHDSWHLLLKAAKKRKGDYQTPVIGTVESQQAQMRVVILREVGLQERQLAFFTDARSDKVAQLKEQARLSWLFWDAGKKVQMRMKGSVELHRKDELCRTYWDRLPVAGRKNYATAAPPGSLARQSTDGLPEAWQDDMPLEETEYAFEHFMVVVSTIDQADLLHLHRDGHQRALFQWEAGEWRGHWAVP